MAVIVLSFLIFSISLLSAFLFLGMNMPTHLLKLQKTWIIKGNGPSFLFTTDISTGYVFDGFVHPYVSLLASRLKIIVLILEILHEESSQIGLEINWSKTKWKNRSKATQTLHAGCCKVEPKKICPATDPLPDQTLLLWHGTAKI